MTVDSLPSSIIFYQGKLEDDCCHSSFFPRDAVLQRTGEVSFSTNYYKLVNNLLQCKSFIFINLLAVSRFCQTRGTSSLSFRGPAGRSLLEIVSVLPLKNIFLACLTFSQDMSQLDDRHLSAQMSS